VRPLWKLSPLKRKLLRDLNRRKISVLVLAAIVMVGVGSLILMTSVYRDLDAARAAYYRDQRLGDFIIDLKRAPESAPELAAGLPQIREAHGRVSMATLLDLDGAEEPLTGLVLSLPPDRRPVLNDVLLRSGAWFSGPDEREALLDHAFAAANRLEPGDRLKVLLLDQQHEVLVVGTVMSPEFVYVIPAGGGFAPDPARFGVLFMPEEFLQRACDLEGAYNQILGRVFDASPAALARTLELLEDLYDPWGVLQATAMIDQPSVRFLNDELRGLKVSSFIQPAVFLGVAMLILNVLAGRIVAQQRAIIGTLRAVGYSPAALAGHFLAFGLAIGLFGGLAGSALAVWLQPLMIGLYRQFYALPRFEAHFHADLHLLGMATSLLFAGAGTVRAARRAARLHPALAMRPPPPERGSHVWLEGVGIVWERLSFRWRLVLRSIFRNPFRSGVNVFAVAVSGSIIVMTFGMVDSLDYLMDYEFRAVSRQELTIALRDPAGPRAPAEFGALAGVSLVEPQLNVPARLSYGSRTKRLGVVGLPRGNRLYTPLDGDGRPITIPPEGLVLADKVARLLGVRVGDVLTLRPLIGQRREVRAPVVAVVPTFLGLGAYADLQYLSRLIGEEWAANALLGSTYDKQDLRATYAEIKEHPTVVGVARRLRALEQMQETFGRNMGVMLTIMVFFAGLIGFGSVVNTSLVSLSEREREVGTLRVLGYGPGEVAAILRGEQLILSALGVGLGLIGGIGLSHLLARAYDTELYRFPVVIHAWRLLQAALILIGFVAFAQVVSLLQVRRIAWLDALKIGE